jgi:ABC transporter DrrB family efflux protein
VTATGLSIRDDDSPIPAAPAAPPPTRPGWVWTLADAWALVGRSMIRMRRQPDTLMFSLVQPVIFVVLFRYVFGGAIHSPVPYVNYLIPGIACQTAIFGAVMTAVALATDMGTGFVERLRSLPMARSAVLVGRVGADLVRNVAVVVVVILVGLVVGFRPHDVVGLVAGALVLLAFTVALSCLMLVLGLTASSAEAAQAASFPVIMPLTFASSAFVPTSSMPAWLRAFADNQPVSLVVDSVRALWLGPVSPQVRAGLFAHSTLTLTAEALAWSAVLGVLGLGLAVRRYRRLG